MKKNILVCDDDKAILDVVTVILNDAGYRISGYSNCENLIEKVKQVMPDLIILDIWMPKIGASEAINILRKDESCKKIPLILMSALNEAETMSKELKVQGFLKKPFNVTDLSRLVEKLIA